MVDVIANNAYASITIDATVEEFVNAHYTLLADAPLLAAIESAYADVRDDYSNAVHKATDAWFSAQRLCTSTIMAQTLREPNTVYRFYFAQDPTSTVTDVMGMTWFGACHGCELTYALGFYEDLYSYLGWGVMPQDFTDEEVTMGNTMKTYWNNFFYDMSPGTVDGLAWSPVSMTERHTMVFKATYPNGAALDPCVDTMACRIEPTNDIRAEAAYLFQDYRRLWHWFGPGPWDADTCTRGTSGPTMAAMGYSAACTNVPDPITYAGSYEAPSYEAPSYEAPSYSYEMEEEDDDDDDDWKKDWRTALRLAAAALAVGVVALVTAYIICCYAMANKGGGGGQSYPNFTPAAASAKTEDV